eukprot:GEMP01004934.1.p1 GENE.GEMP01004934.1~~GEMP01004934.1.p1  ORF type:complete len:1005 (+),score=199.45 GEMP01004934.1:73-3087(+)
MNIPDDVYMKEVVDPAFRPIINEVVKTMPLDMPKFLRRYLRGKKYVVLDYKTEYQTKVLIPIFDSLVKQCLADRPSNPSQWMMNLLDQEGDIPWGAGVTDFNYNRLSVVTKIDRNSIVGSKRFSVATMIPSDLSTPAEQLTAQTPPPSSQKSTQLIPQAPGSHRNMLSEIPEEHEYPSPRAVSASLHDRQPATPSNKNKGSSLPHVPPVVVGTNDAAGVVTPAAVVTDPKETEVVTSFAFKKRAKSPRLGRPSANPSSREVCGKDVDDFGQFPRSARMSCGSRQSGVSFRNAHSTAVGGAQFISPSQDSEAHTPPLRSSVRSRTCSDISQIAQGCDTSHPYPPPLNSRPSTRSEALSHAHRISVGSGASLARSSIQHYAYSQTKGRTSIGSKESYAWASEKQYTPDQASSPASLCQEGHTERTNQQFAHSHGGARASTRSEAPIVRASDQQQPAPLSSHARPSMHSESSAVTWPNMHSEAYIGPVVGKNFNAETSRPSETCLPKLTSWPYDTPKRNLPSNAGRSTCECLENNHCVTGSPASVGQDVDDSTAMQPSRQSDFDSHTLPSAGEHFDVPNADCWSPPHSSTRDSPNEADRREDVAAAAARNRRDPPNVASGDVSAENPYTVATPMRAIQLQGSLGRMSDTGSSAYCEDMSACRTKNAPQITHKPDPIPVVRYNIPTNATTRDFCYDESAAAQNIRKSSSVLLERQGLRDDYRNAPPLTASMRSTPPFDRESMQMQMTVPRKSLSASLSMESPGRNLMDGKHGWVAPSPDEWRDSVRPTRGYAQEQDEDMGDAPHAARGTTRPSDSKRPCTRRRDFSHGASFHKASQADGSDWEDAGTPPSMRRRDFSRGASFYKASQADGSDWEDAGTHSTGQRRVSSPGVPFRTVSREDSSDWEDDLQSAPTIGNGLHKFPNKQRDTHECAAGVTSQRRPVPSPEMPPLRLHELTDRNAASHPAADSAILHLDDFLGHRSGYMFDGDDSLDETPGRTIPGERSDRRY